MRRLMVMIPIDEKTPVAYVGCYVMQWGKIDVPTVMFVEATDDEIAEAFVEVLEKRNAHAPRNN